MSYHYVNGRRRTFLGAIVGAGMQFSTIQVPSLAAPQGPRDNCASAHSLHTPVEPIIEPELPIVDPHIEMWFLPDAALANADSDTRDAPTMQAYGTAARNRARYLLEEVIADLATGHNVRATVFAESGAMYRSSGS